MTPGTILALADSALNRGSNYWFSLYQQKQQFTLARVGPDGLWDVVFAAPDQVPHAVEGVDPLRFVVIKAAPTPRRWWQFWRKG